MPAYHYRITLAPDADTAAQSREWQYHSRENIDEIIATAQARHGFSPETAQQFVLGLKLLGGAMMDEREHPLFQQLKPHFLEIMKCVKHLPRE